MKERAQLQVFWSCRITINTKVDEKKCPGLKNPVEFTCMKGAYCDNNAD